jgi:hypothetical protein
MLAALLLAAAIDSMALVVAPGATEAVTGTARVMVFPRAVGDCVVLSDVTEDEVRFGIEAALAG